jgi:hypothetical protein
MSSKKLKRYTLKYSLGNMEIKNVAEGSIGRWVAHFGGDDAQMERLLLDKSVTIGRETLSLHEENANAKV